jgi:hypothetical protein
VSEWTTPVRPMVPGRLWCVWEHGGVYEWMVHPDTARELLQLGIRIDGEWCPVKLIDEWPGINAWQIRAEKAIVTAVMPQLRSVA